MKLSSLPPLTLGVHDESSCRFAPPTVHTHASAGPAHSCEAKALFYPHALKSYGRTYFVCTKGTVRTVSPGNRPYRPGPKRVWFRGARTILTREPGRTGQGQNVLVPWCKSETTISIKQNRRAHIGYPCDLIDSLIHFFAHN